MMGRTIRSFGFVGKNVIVYIDGRETGTTALAARWNRSELTHRMKNESLDASARGNLPRTREFDTANTRRPHIAILGRSPFTTLITNSGSGQTRFGAIAVTRWRSDPTLDDSGHWCYVKDLTTDKMWSAGFQPTCIAPSWYKVRFDDSCVSFQRKDGDIQTMMEMVVSADDAVEIRRVTLRNTSNTQHDVELTSCAEVVIAPFNADRGHPAFSNLFVQTEWIAESHAILAMRRPRSAENDPVWCGHAVCVDGTPHEVSCETDRAQFIGRGRSYRNPLALERDGSLSNRTGAVLDPVFSIRARLSIPPGDSTSVSFVTFMATDREHAHQMARTFSNRSTVDELLSRVRSESGDDRASLYQELAGELLFPKSGPLQHGGGRAELESLGISGELPIIVARVESDQSIPAVAELLAMQRYWRSVGIRCDLVFVSNHESLHLERAVVDANSDTALLRDAESFTFPGYAISVRTDAVSQQQLHALSSNARIEIDCSTFELMQYAYQSRSAS